MHAVKYLSQYQRTEAIEKMETVYIIVSIVRFFFCCRHMHAIDVLVLTNAIKFE